jgi:hypothetical protein
VAGSRRKRGRVGPSNPKYASAVKKSTGSDALADGGGAHLGRTIFEQAHKSHPKANSAFVAPRGKAKSKPMPDEHMIGAKKAPLKKSASKKKSEK